jgi:DNA-directed RNA polymerase sigma subunit (sigma70/sigma32)
MKMPKKRVQNDKININKSKNTLNNSEFLKKSKKDSLVNLLKNITEEEDIFKEDLTFSNITTNKEEIYKKLKLGSFNNYNWLIDNYQRFKNIPLDLEREIIKDAKEGNYQAKILLISIIFPFIIKIYKSLIGKNLEYSEYISEGVAAALEAIERFDINYNVRFSTYATYWIYHSIFKTNYNQDNLLKVPLSIYTEYQKIIKTKTFLENKYNRKVSLEEVIEYLFKDSITKELLQEENVTTNDQIFKKRYRLKIKELVSKYSKILKLSNYKIELSLQDFKYDEGNRTFEDYIENKIEECPENLFNKSFLKSKIIEYINTYLEDEEKLLVISSFGILDKRPLNLNELTDLYFTVYGKRLSKERIRQMLNKALIKLKKYIPKDIIELYS